MERSDKARPAAPAVLLLLLLLAGAGEGARFGRAGDAAELVGASVGVVVDLSPPLRACFRGSLQQMAALRRRSESEAEDGGSLLLTVALCGAGVASSGASSTSATNLSAGAPRPIAYLTKTAPDRSSDSAAAVAAMLGTALGMDRRGAWTGDERPLDVYTHDKQTGGTG